MVILFACLIPIITSIILYLFFQHKVLWWEFGIVFLASIITVFTAKLAVEHTSIQSEEYWGAFVDKVEYYEEWDEWIDDTCTRSCCCDSKGENCGTEKYDCSYRKHHDPYWEITTTIGETISITKKEYARIKNLFKNETFSELNRDYYRIDGDKYGCTWDKDSALTVPVTTLHYYENRVKASDASVFHFDDLEEDEIARYDLKEYPPIKDNYKMDAIIGDSSHDAIVANKKLKYINGALGHSKEVCVFVLVFKNQPLEAAFKQEAHWKGANMNEMVVCVGIDDERNVGWCKVISWTPNEALKGDIRDIINSQKKLSLSKFADKLQPALASFQRRDFKEFDYLTVEPSWTAIIVSYVIVIIVNILVSAYVIHNEHEEGGARPYGFRC